LTWKACKDAVVPRTLSQGGRSAACDQSAVKARAGSSSVGALDLTHLLAHRGAGGIGIHQVQTVMDTPEYRHEGGRKMRVMKKRVTA
jgi:hypothetical protein